VPEVSERRRTNLAPGVVPRRGSWPPGPRQLLPTEAITERLRVLRLGKTEHHEAEIIAAQGVRHRTDFLSGRRFHAGRNQGHHLGITELGLTFGNTWQVIGIVFAGILIMAFLGNCLVQWLNIKRPLMSYVFLLAVLAVRC
jgi:hypothetical protein